MKIFPNEKNSYYRLIFGRNSSPPCDGAAPSNPGPHLEVDHGHVPQQRRAVQLHADAPQSRGFGVRIDNFPSLTARDPWRKKLTPRSQEQPAAISPDEFPPLMSSDRRGRQAQRMKEQHWQPAIKQLSLDAFPPLMAEPLRDRQR